MIDPYDENNVIHTLEENVAVDTREEEFGVIDHMKGHWGRSHEGRSHREGYIEINTHGESIDVYAYQESIVVTTEEEYFAVDYKKGIEVQHMDRLCCHRYT